MREILFKGQSINGEWFEGLLSISQGLTGQPPKGSYISNKSGMPWAYNVRPETVCQFTGYFDKNGKRIFEGDILIYIASNMSSMEVKFEDGCFVGVGPFNTHPLHVYFEATDFESVEFEENVYDKTCCYKR